MQHRTILTNYILNFIDELIISGLKDVVISPGSRSTPLAMGFVSRKDINDWIIVDERSAAFFALGIAKRSNRPVALVCTSGTAVANYYPAIVEAYHNDIPLIVLTADRPHELRKVEAPQTIDQQKIYGDFVVYYDELALPDGKKEMIQYVRQKASALFSTSFVKKGPVHLNIPLREPLLIDTDQSIHHAEVEQFIYPIEKTKRVASEETIEQIVRVLEENTKGLIVVGPQQCKETARAILHLAKAYQLPILADPLSQIRNVNQTEEIIYTYDAILKDESIRKKLQPQYIIRFGKMPISKMYRFFVEENENLTQIIVHPKIHYGEETRKKTHFLHVDIKHFIHELIHEREVYPNKAKRNWLLLWQRLNGIAKEQLLKSTNDLLTEGSAVVHLNTKLKRKANVFIANSMAVRDFDTFYFGNENIKVFANRGANGIDGVVSTALGVGANKEHTILFIGDLSFYHDMNGLHILKKYNLNVTIVLINNDGGGIFSFLPQKNIASFEEVFGTPLDLNFEHVANLYEAHYYKVQTVEQYKKALQKSLYKDRYTIIEVQTNRSENYKWHQKRWQAVIQKISQEGLIE